MTEQLAGVSSRVEGVAQVGVAPASRVGTLAKERVTSLV